MKKLISVICIILMLTGMTSTVEAAKKDTKAPVITKSSPVDCGSDIMIESSILIRFDEGLMKGKNIAKISLKENETKNIGFTYELTGGFLKLIPKANLKYKTLYTVTIPAAAVKDASGNSFAKAYSFNFITEEDPKVVAANTGSTVGTKYIIEIEATLQKILDATTITYFEEMLERFGIDATFKDIYVEEDSKSSK